MRRRMEDYLEAIYHLTSDGGSARTTAIARILGVQPGSATEMLQKLAARDLITYRKYEGVELTLEGRRVGRAVSEKHHTLCELLKMMQVPESIADRDACTMEHNLNPVTILQLKKFVRFMQECPEPVPRWLEHFKEYSQTGTFPQECCRPE